jgi:hypothetical protein
MSRGTAPRSSGQLTPPAATSNSILGTNVAIGACAGISAQQDAIAACDTITFEERPT